MIGVYNHTKDLAKDSRFTQIDLRNFNALRKWILKMKPDAIINLAAVSNLSAVEENSDYAYQLNVVIPSMIASLAFEANIPYLYTSSDQVFDGKKGNYDFGDMPEPIHLYGKQKFEAERRILSAHPQATIVRLPLLYGYAPGRANFLLEWSERLIAEKKVKAFTDEYRTPIRARDAVKGIVDLLTQERIGIWHLGGPEKLSRYEMGRLIAKELKVDTDLVIPVKQKDLDLHPSRPSDVSLNSDKTFGTGFEPKSMEEALPKIIAKLKKKI